MPEKEIAKINVDYLLSHLQSNAFHNEVNNYQIFDPRYAHHFPWFNFLTIETMLRDPRIVYGLNLIKGPIATYTKFFSEEESESPDIHTAIVELNYHFPYAVICKNKEQEEYIISQLNRFWDVGLMRALKALEWGFSGSQILYKKNSKGQLIFDNLHPYHSQELRCLTRKRGVIGFIRNNDRNRYIPIGKGFWHVHGRDYDSFYGISRLKGAHVPWHETWMMGGARDIRRTWFFRHAYDGGEIYYPEGSYQDENGQTHSNETLAVKMAEAKRTGSTAIFPSTKDLSNKRLWEYEAPKAGVTPQGLGEYIQLLRDEELEGMGIPPEVVQSGSGNGLGSATGRMVPLMAFIASLTPIGSDLLTDFRQQILDPVLLPLAKFKDDYQIKRIVPKTPPSGPGQNQITDTVKDSGLTN